MATWGGGCCGGQLPLPWGQESCGVPPPSGLQALEHQGSERGLLWSGERLSLRSPPLGPCTTSVASSRVWVMKPRKAGWGLARVTG